MSIYKKAALTFLCSIIGLYIGIGIMFIPAFTDLINIFKDNDPASVGSVGWAVVRILFAGFGGLVVALIPIVIGGISILRQANREYDQSNRGKVSVAPPEEPPPAA